MLLPAGFCLQRSVVPSPPTSVAANRPLVTPSGAQREPAPVERIARCRAPSTGTVRLGRLLRDAQRRSRHGVNDVLAFGLVAGKRGGLRGVSSWRQRRLPAQARGTSSPHQIGAVRPSSGDGRPCRSNAGTATRDDQDQPAGLPWGVEAGDSRPASFLCSAAADDLRESLGHLRIERASADAEA